MRNIKNELEENGIAIIRNFATEAECDELRNGIVGVVKSADMGKVKFDQVNMFPFTSSLIHHIIDFFFDLNKIRSTRRSICEYKQLSIVTK